MKWWHTRLKRSSGLSPLHTVRRNSHGEDTGPGQRACDLDPERGRTGSPFSLVSCGSKGAT